MNTNLIVGARVLVLTIYEPEDPSMLIYLGHTAKITEIDCNGDYPITLCFENEALQKFYKHQNEPTFGFLELHDLTGVDFVDSQLLEPGIGDRVIIIDNLSHDEDARTDKEKYVGEIGTVVRDYHYDYRYSIDFDDEELNKENIHEGRWLFTTKEAVVLKKGGSKKHA